MLQKIKQNKLFFSFVGLILAYAILSITAPVDPETTARFNIDESMVRLILLTIVVPISIIWLIAFYGYSKVYSYGKSLGAHKDGIGFTLLAKGLMWLAISILLPAVVEVAFDRIIAHRPDMQSIFTIIVNYLKVLLVLISYTTLSRGAYHLKSLVKARQTITKQHAWVIVSTIMSALFTFLIHIRPSNESPVYYMPHLLVIITIVMPLVYAWYRGMLAAYHLHLYRKKVDGMLYTKGLSFLTFGIIATIASSILMQFLIAVAPSLEYLSLTPILSFLYFLVSIIGLSFGLIAIGARKLQLIEKA